MGVVFGLGWTPCLGPTLGAVNTLALTEASAVRGAVLGLAYCVGLGLPFLLVAAGTGRALRLSAFARRHARTVTRIGGGFLVLLGVLLLTGLWDGSDDLDAGLAGSNRSRDHVAASSPTSKPLGSRSILLRRRIGLAREELDRAVVRTGRG
ncbi:MAG: cytochrome c biogenesis protein CcdA [Geodermatophilaceae bacterium]